MLKQLKKRNLFQISSLLMTCLSWAEEQPSSEAAQAAEEQTRKLSNRDLKAVLIF